MLFGAKIRQKNGMTKKVYENKWKFFVESEKVFIFALLLN